MGGPDDMDAGMRRRDVVKGIAATLGAMATAPFLFAGLANARDCEGKRCGNWHMKASPEPRVNPEEVKRFKDDMNTDVSEYKNEQELLSDIMTHHKIDPSRYTISLVSRGRAISFSVSESGKEVGRIIIPTTQLYSAYGVDVNQPMEKLINKKGFQRMFFHELQQLRLTEK